MQADEYGQAVDLFDQLRELPESHWAAALEAACAGNPELRAQVARLLKADRKAAGAKFLENSAIEDAARLIAAPGGLGTLSPGSRLGPYEIVAALGAGGMGEVYRARDSQLNRDVAIKVLPAVLAGDAQYMARFEQEAQVLAQLNHPNIAAIYAVERGALVMEFVEGANLCGPLPLEDAIPIARQIAAGLEAAHERGIVHRDLKPANIRITPSGVVKLLDFGLAKSPDDAASMPELNSAVSPTPSPAVTLAGMIVGTAAYMSPEQARGKPVDKRADIWAFGVVLYEMLTGSRPFVGETIAATVASVLKDTPDWNKLPRETPPHIRRLLVRCLRKDANTRLRDIGEARVLLDELGEPSAAEPAAARPPRRIWLAWVAVAAIVAVATAVLWPRPAAQEPPAVRFFVAPPGKASFSGVSLPALSPDGRHLAFVAETDSHPQLWIRDLDAIEARPLPATDGAADPFWSPDSRFVGFFVPGALKTIAIAGGPAVRLCNAPDGRGGSWNQNNVIVFTPSYGAPLFRVPAAGGTPSPVTTLEAPARETSHRFPWFLPDGRHFLFTARSGSPEKTAVYAGDLESKERRLVIAAASNAVYSPPGVLLFMRRNTLMAQRFDAPRLRTIGEPLPVAEHVNYVEGTAQGQFSVSQTGVLAYSSGGGSLRSQLTWFNRSGQPLGTVGPAAVMQAAVLAPNGKSVVVDRLDPALGTYDLWLLDLAHGTESRLTFDPGNDMFPVWSPDGSRILFTSNRGGGYGLYQKAANGAGKEQLLYEAGGVTLPTDWSADGRFAIFDNATSKAEDDVWVLPLASDRKAFPFLQADFGELHAKLSPDGHWLAYESNETGEAEVYVQPFPSADGKWQVSAQGGTRPLWSHDGTELFYVSTDSKIMAVPVKAGAKFEHGIPQALFPVRMPPASPFDISRDGKRFLILNGADPESDAPMTLVVHWDAALKK